jgi:hypothetical protein
LKHDKKELEEQIATNNSNISGKKQAGEKTTLLEIKKRHLEWLLLRPQQEHQAAARAPSSSTSGSARNSS